MRAKEFIIEQSVRDQILQDLKKSGGNLDDYFVRFTDIDKLGYSTRQAFGRSPDVDDPSFDVEYIGTGKGRPALWFYPIQYYLKHKDIYGSNQPYAWLVKLKPNSWLQTATDKTNQIEDPPSGKERVGILRLSHVPAAIFFQPAFDVVGKYYDYAGQHQRHGEVKGRPSPTVMDRLRGVNEGIDFTNAVNSVEKLIRQQNIPLKTYEDLVRFVAGRNFLQAQKNDAKFIDDVARAVLRRLHQPVMEGRDAPLYHVMGEEKAANVFATDTMPARWTHDIPGVGKVQGNSFTRNQHYKQTDYAGAEGFVCRIVVDQRRLAQTHKIIPLHGELIYSYAGEKDFLDQYGFDTTVDINKLAQDPSNLDRGVKTPTESMDEEFVVGDITNLHKYITQIDIWSSVATTTDKGKFLVYLLQYAKKYNIPVNISADAQASVDKLLKRQQGKK